MKKDNAFTGLEAAIVLIAFVVVAAVFSYVLLGAGFFATQKAQEVTYAGIQQTTSNMYLVGQVYGNVDEYEGHDVITSIDFKLGIPEGAQPQDASQMQLLFSNNTGLPTTLTPASTIDNAIDSNSNSWNVSAINGEKVRNHDVRLYPGDKADIHIELNKVHNVSSERGDLCGGVPCLSRTFTLEIKPRIGAAYLIEKTLSTGFDHGPLY